MPLSDLIERLGRTIFEAPFSGVQLDQPEFFDFGRVGPIRTRTERLRLSVISAERYCIVRRRLDGIFHNWCIAAAGLGHGPDVVSVDEADAVLAHIGVAEHGAAGLVLVSRECW